MNLCPFCLKETKFVRVPPNGGGAPILACPLCKDAIPALYARERDRERLILSTVGFRQHGKTVYLASLIWALRDARLAARWPRYSTMAADEATLATIESRAKALEQGALPESTPQAFPKPLILNVSGLPTAPDLTLLCYDTGGESFQSGSQVAKYARFVQNASTVLFLLSIPDLVKSHENLGREALKLLEIYCHGVAQLAVGEARSERGSTQNLVVVLTKADEINGRLTPPEELRDYLSRPLEDQQEEMLHRRRYMARLRRNSKIIRKYLRDADATQFINAAEQNFDHVAYVMVSALGTSPTKDRMAVNLKPRRVLDPLLVALRPKPSLMGRLLGLA